MDISIILQTCRSYGAGVFGGKLIFLQTCRFSEADWKIIIHVNQSPVTHGEAAPGAERL